MGVEVDKVKRKQVVWVVLGAGALVALGSYLQRAKAERKRTMSETNGKSAGEDSLETVEIETDAVDDDGNLVIDDLVVAVDSAGNIVAADETIAVITTEGDAVVDEKLSVVGEDGKLHTVEEDISVLEAEDK
jgi:hypothetical protein